jgi:CheY-like chemotaxis protein
MVRADHGQLEQVITNLAVNARDAMPNGGKLTIETAYVDLDEQYAARHVGVLPGGYVVIAVSDTGSGMKKEEKARIFEPFFTTKKQGKGIGLGLATVYGIIKQSGGNVLVYSEPGKGTTFKVYLPRLEVSAEALLPGALEVSSGSTGSETILIVEDEAAVRKAAVRILEAAGYKVLSSNNGGEALLTCEQYDGSIHLLLTDVIMPQMNGRQLAERLVAIRPGLQVLFMSGYTDTAIARHGVLDAGIHFINKPINANDLRRKVREVLDTPIAGEK